MAKFLTITLAEFHSVLSESIFVFLLGWGKFKGQAAGESCGHGGTIFLDSNPPLWLFLCCTIAILSQSKLLSGATDIFRNILQWDPQSLFVLRHGKTVIHTAAP